MGVRPSSMADIRVRILGEDEWQLYREVRLAALRDAPEAFVARFEDEGSYGDNFWRERMIRARRIVAERGDELVGLVWRIVVAGGSASTYLSGTPSMRR